MRFDITFYNGDELNPVIRKLPNCYALKFYDGKLIVFFNNLEEIEHLISLLQIEIIKQREK